LTFYTNAIIFIKELKKMEYLMHEHPAVARHCTEQERDVFDRISNGEDASIFDEQVIQALVEKGLLTNHDGSIYPPAIVWSQWSQFVKEQQSAA
jgi:hypothetical protein